MTQRIVLFLDERPEGGGAYQYSLAIAQALAASDEVEPAFVYTNANWEKVLAGVRGEKFFLPMPTAIRILRKIQRKFRMNLAGFIHSSLSLSGAWRKIGEWQKCAWIFPAQDDYSYLLPVKSIVAIHDLMHRYAKGFPEANAEGQWRDHHYKKICQSAEMIFVDSTMGADHVCQSYGEQYRKKLFVLPFTTHLHAAMACEPVDFSPRNIPARFFYYPAQYWQHKNHVLILRALALLLSRYPEMQVVFSGATKNASAAIEELSRSLRLDNNIHHLGYVSEPQLVWLYKNAVALLMPSFFGPTNIPPLEAMALGCPMALADVYGMREQSGDAAIYFSPHKENELADAMERLWLDSALREKLCQAGKMRFPRLSPAAFKKNILLGMKQLTGAWV